MRLARGGRTEDAGVKRSAATGYRHSGFTLAELLAVAIIIAVLVAIMLPSLYRARSQARMVVCLSHEQQIANALMLYLDDHESRPPIGPPEQLNITETGEGTYVEMRTKCHWGGRRAAFLHGGIDESQNRPLNPYLYPDAPLDIDKPVFRCPADQPTEWSASLLPGRPVYEVCGNSYYYNMFGTLERLSMPPTSLPSRIVVFHEAPLYDFLRNRTVGLGWHGEYGRHNVLFLDGHAEYMRIDSRQRSGVRWTVEDFVRLEGFYE